MKLGILLSGRGSNMQAIYRAISSGNLAADIAVVISDKPSAPGLESAASYGLKTLAFSPKDYDTKAAYETDVQRALEQAGVEWVVLAGYMRLLGPTLLHAFRDRILNIHPSLLPHFKGLHPQRQALEAGHKESGCTVHLVTEDLDAGPILGQRSVPIEPEDTEESLSERILVEEHHLYSEVLAGIASGKLTVPTGL